MKPHPKLQLLAFLCIFSFAYSDDSPRKLIVKGEVIEFGLFEPIGPSKLVPMLGTPTNRQETANDERFIEKTNQVPATLGILFGFRFKITGLPAKGLVEIKRVITHPPFKNAKGEISRGYTITEVMPIENGSINEVWGYRLNRPEELLTGDWNCEIWCNDQKIVAQAFTVIEPKMLPLKRQSNGD